MDDSEIKTFKVKTNYSLKSILENPQREISLTKCTRQDNDGIYWLIQTALPEYGPEHNQELVISNEALDEVLRMKSTIDKLPPPKYNEIKTTWINIPDGVSSPPIETFIMTVDVLKDEIPSENIEKNPGYDWVITYQIDDDPIEEMNVFGAMTIKDAIKEAQLNLTVCDTPEMKADYIILGARRVDGV